MAKISSKSQITIPASALDEAGLRRGDEVLVEADAGELRIRRGKDTFESAFGALTGVYPPGYLDELDADDAER